MKKRFLPFIVGAALALCVGCGQAQTAETTAASDSATTEQAATEQATTEQASSEQTTSDVVFKIGAIPDYDQSLMEKSLDDFATYLSTKTGLKVEYVPTVDYASLVTAFERGDIQMAWFGGLTAVQALDKVPEAQVFAQRPADAKFKSVFIEQKGLGLKELTDLKGKTFTFGSESSTSGHLMPRYFLKEAGINPESDFDGQPNYSGSHDKTYKLVEAGSYQTGAVNMQYWDKAVAEGKVDTTKVEEFYRTPEFFDYNWTLNKDIDAKYGDGTAQKVKDVVLSMKAGDSKVMDLLSTDSFIESNNDNYAKIKEVAQELKMVR